MHPDQASLLHRACLSGQKFFMYYTSGGVRELLRRLVAIGYFESEDAAQRACMATPRLAEHRSLQRLLEVWEGVHAVGGTPHDARRLLQRCLGLKTLLAALMLWSRVRCASCEPHVDVCCKVADVLICAAYL